ncbi:unnamed protein product [Parnassius apollo]|uniref:(apollo) hypothetical protein n=1 Tax=Parnassius apollo TaxID=110799 RepID=A0A8S3WU31_PARAO|nr:unnamed protein product [Parnassius apollo]
MTCSIAAAGDGDREDESNGDLGVKQGINFNNWSEESLIKKSYKLKYVSPTTSFAMELLQIFLFLILSGFLEKFRPGKYGVQLPWNFFLQKKYWTAKMTEEKKKTDIKSIYDPADEKYFVDPPDDLKVAVTVNNVQKIYKGIRTKVVALDKVSLKFYKGEITVLIGHNGAGKTTLLYIIAGMLKQSSGNVEVEDFDTVLQQAKLKRKIGLCPQRNIFINDLTVEEHLIFFSKRIGPLPGGRRGASGAGAGRGSMRADSQVRGAARSPSSPTHPSSPPDGLMSAGSSRTRQAASAAGGVRRVRCTRDMNANALRAYYRAKGEETAGIAYRARMHCFFAELEPSIPVTEQNLADRVRYIMRLKIFDDAELERLRREAIPSSNELATAGDAAPQATDQLPRVEAVMDLPVVVESDDDEMISHELEQMRSILEEAILETRSMPLENRPRLPRTPLSKRNRAVVRALNPMLVTYLEASRDLCETDSVLFGTVVAACHIIGAKLPIAGRATKQSSAIPAWRKRIEDRIAKARALIGRLISFRSGNNRPRVVRTVRMAFAGTNISLSQPDITQKLTERIDDLKQKIAAWGKRIRRFTERSRRFN